MTTLLQEVPGAMERPGGCRIQIIESDEGHVTIDIPPRRATPFLIVIAILLTVNLLLALWTGIMALVFHHSVLLMSQISPQDLPLSIRPFASVLFLTLAAVLGIGFAAVAIILRPLFIREILSIGREAIAHQRSVFRHAERWESRLADVRGFHLKRDPQGFAASVLTVQVRAEEHIIGEGLAEADREWLVSVGNALLRH